VADPVDLDALEVSARIVAEARAYRREHFEIPPTGYVGHTPAAEYDAHIDALIAADLVGEVRRLRAEVDLVADRATRAVVQMGAHQRAELAEFWSIGWAVMFPGRGITCVVGREQAQRIHDHEPFGYERNLVEVFVRDPLPAGEVGTGAGAAGDPAQTEATAGVTRSEGFPEDPAQAHLPAPLPPVDTQGGEPRG
jgi:hypothetical protein